MRFMMTFKIAGFATAALLLSTTLAFAEATLTPEVEQKIKDTLTAQGYEVGKIKIEDGMYEVYAKKGGEKIELFLNDKLEVVKTEND